MAQSIELTLDPVAEAAILGQWHRLAEAGLPSSLRPRPSPHHRPHITLYAAAALTDHAEAALPELLTGLDLSVRIGAVLLFGPRRGGYVLVRQVVTSVELLNLQQRVVETCGADPGGGFGAGRWTPHVTLAPRIRPGQLGAAVEVLADGGEVVARLTDCRRWDGERHTAWWVTAGTGPLPSQG